MKLIPAYLVNTGDTLVSSAGTPDECRDVIDTFTLSETVVTWRGRRYWPNDTTRPQGEAVTGAYGADSIQLVVN